MGEPEKSATVPFRNLRPWPLIVEREGYYYRARAWFAASPIVRAALEPRRVDEFRRIQSIGDAWGLRLDELRASYRMVQWIAGAAGERFVAERERRYRALVKLLEEHGAERDVGRRFDALRASMPKVGRARVREEREAAGG